jgi:predicted anti-sigma-YlaC factor YlaD
MKEHLTHPDPINCRMARKQFSTLLAAERDARVVPINRALNGERVAAERHLEDCQRCATEYQILALSRATLDAAAAPDPVLPNEDFFKAVRARIHRQEPVMVPVERPDESWAAALFATARQLIPVMAVLLLLIIGATFIWNGAPNRTSQVTQGVASLPRLDEDPASPEEALDGAYSR